MAMESKPEPKPAYEVLDEEIEEYYRTFYLDPPRAFSHEELMMRQTRNMIRLEEWMPEKVKEKIDAAYGVAIESLLRFYETTGLEPNINRRELYVLCWLVHRSLVKSGVMYGLNRLAGEIAYKLYLLSRGIYVYMTLDEVGPVRGLYRNVLNEFVRRAIGRMSLGNPMIQMLLGTAYAWFRSRNPVVWTSLQCAAKIASLVLGTVTYAEMIRTVYPWDTEPRSFAYAFKKLGIEIETRPPYTTVDRLVLPDSLCRALEKVVELPRFVECRG